jgi:transcriptional regulator with XRE-family HTH domain
MGYRGKVDERARARELRAAGWTMPDIASELGVSRSSVSLWTRDVQVVMGPRRILTPRPNRLRDRRLAEVAAMDDWATDRLGPLSEQAFLAAGAALYAGEGSKADGTLVFANSDPGIVAFYLRWLRHFFVIDESRLRIALYLHEGLDLDAAEEAWSQLTNVPRKQFTKPYRAVANASIRNNKHEHGCCRVVYSCSRTHRGVMGLVRALLSSTEANPG